MNKAVPGSPYQDGFRYVRKIPKNYGLFFPWDGGMVMDHCYAPLSAGFIDSFGQIVDIQDMLPEPEADKPSVTYRSDKPYQYVLEVAKDWFQQNGWGVGDKLSWTDDNIYKTQDEPILQEQEFSVISLPKARLDSAIWDLESGEDKPLLRPEVQRELVTRLYNGLKEYGFDNPAKWVARMLIVGSETGNQYDSTSDLDINTVIAFESFRTFEPRFDTLQNEEIIKTIGSVFANDINGKSLFTTKHDVNYYAKTDEASPLDDYDGVYDIYSNEWVKYPDITSEDFDPETAFPEVFETAQKLAREFDIKLGDIRRDSVNASYLIEQLKDKNVDRATVKEKLDDSIAKLDQSLHELFSEYEQLHNDRKTSYSTNDVANLRDGYLASKNWLPANIKYKWLEKWRYVALVQLLKKIWKNPALSDTGKVKQVQKTFKLAAGSKQQVLSSKDADKLAWNEVPVKLGNFVAVSLQDAIQIKQDMASLQYIFNTANQPFCEVLCNIAQLDEKTQHLYPELLNTIALTTLEKYNYLPHPEEDNIELRKSAFHAYLHDRNNLRSLIKTPPECDVVCGDKEDKPAANDDIPPVVASQTRIFFLPPSSLSKNASVSELVNQGLAAEDMESVVKIASQIGLLC